MYNGLRVPRLEHLFKAKGEKMGKLTVWMKNLPSFHHRIMARYLRKRNWVVFYLEPKDRVCIKDHCWLKLYESEELRKKIQ